MKRRVREDYEQLTRFKAVRFCRTCQRLVVHQQVADFDKVTGFKSYRWLAVAHFCAARRPR